MSLLPENMLILTDIRIARVTLNVGILLANPSRDLLVPHIDARVSFFGDQVSWSGYELRRGVRKQQSSGRHSGDSRILQHLGLQKLSQDADYRLQEKD